jgi:hypothetical protein
MEESFVRDTSRPSVHARRWSSSTVSGSVGCTRSERIPPNAARNAVPDPESRSTVNSPEENRLPASLAVVCFCTSGVHARIPPDWTLTAPRSSMSRRVRSPGSSGASVTRPAPPVAVNVVSNTSRSSLSALPIMPVTPPPPPLVSLSTAAVRERNDPGSARTDSPLANSTVNTALAGSFSTVNSIRSGRPGENV